MQTRIPAALMRGGTSKGLYFLASDLPADPVLSGTVSCWPRWARTTCGRSTESAAPIP